MNLPYLTLPYIIIEKVACSSSMNGSHHGRICRSCRSRRSRRGDWSTLCLFPALMARGFPVKSSTFRLGKIGVDGNKPFPLPLAAPLPSLASTETSTPRLLVSYLLLKGSTGSTLWDVAIVDCSNINQMTATTDIS